MHCEDLEDPTALSADDIVILIMGLTGVGKSNFIDRLLDQEGRRAGSSMKSCTSEVGATRIVGHPHYGNRIVLVDTPGFNDTEKLDIEILEIISAWLIAIDKKQIQIRGILYLHRISDARLTGSHLRNYEAFKAICGEQNARNIILVTTMWDQFSDDSARTNEKELISNYWSSLIKYGAFSKGFYNTYESAWIIIFTNLSSPQHVRLQLQLEMVDEKKVLWETTAGRIIMESMKDLFNKPEKAIDLKPNPTAGTQQMSTRALPTGSFGGINHIQDNMSATRYEKFAVIKDARELKQDDFIIAIMGPTGCGKSHMFDTLIGEYAKSGLHAQSPNVVAIRIKKHEIYCDRLVILDTPGFDDTERPDLEILEMISQWPLEVHQRNICVKGIIYLHRITDNRMAGSPHRNLRIMGELCGDKGAAGVVLVTTMWDLLKHRQVGEIREEDLIRNFWGEMLNHGATFDRFENTVGSAWSIIHKLISKNTTGMVLLIQEEIAQLGRALEEAKAAQALLADLHRLQARQKHQLVTLRSLSKVKPDSMSQEELDGKIKAMEKQITMTAELIEKLQISFGRRVILFFKRNGNGRALAIKREN